MKCSTLNLMKPTQNPVHRRAVPLHARCLTTLITAALLCGACAPAGNEPPPAAAASDQTEARREIEAAALAIWQAVGRGDAAAIANHYADDALIFGSGAPMVQGKPAIAAFLKGLFEGNTFSDVQGHITDIMIGGDLAVETGTYAMTIAPKNGNAITDRGKFIHVWKKSADGAWKVVRYAPTSDIPPR
jgi:uncharacterized protein (TIGR02246 family)